MADEYTLKLYTEADFNEVFTYEQADGTPFDLTNYDSEILIGHAGDTRIIEASTDDTITIDGVNGAITVNIPKASIAGHSGKSIDINIEPALTRAGRVLTVILRMPVGTTAGSQVIQGLVAVKGYHV